MCMALKLQGWKDGVTCNHTRAIVKWGSFPTAILKLKSQSKGDKFEYGANKRNNFIASGYCR